MRATRVMRLVAWPVAFCVAAGSVGAQQPPTPLEFYAVTDDYPGLAYGAPPVPPADLVLYRGEELWLTLSVANLDQQPHRLSIPTAKSPAPFRTGWIESTAKRRPPVLVVLESPASDTVPARGELRWKASMRPDTADAVGQYALTVEPAFAGASARILGVGTIVRYELREAHALPETVESLRRQAVRADRSGNADVALSLLDELLALYPAAYLAYARKGEIFEAADRKAEALLAYLSARQLLSEGRDHLLQSSVESQHAVILRLSAKIEELQR